jgi:hypothetical protein
MLGTNDVIFGVDPVSYENNLRAIVGISKEMGVIPVLSTIPDNTANPDHANLVHVYNDIVIRVARDGSVPLWNYWRAMQPLPNKGISGDGVHPSQNPANESAIFSPEDVGGYGYTVRNLTALQVLHAVARGAMY